MNIELEIKDIKHDLNYAAKCECDRVALNVYKVQTLLTAYENQQKEIQNLIINQCIYQNTSSCTRSISLKMYTF